MKKKKEPETTIIIYRDAGTGKFVRKDYAKKNPKTTEKENRTRKPK